MENAPQALTELISINDLMVRSKEFRSLLVNPRFTPEERASVIKSLTEKLKLSENTVKFVLHITDVGVISSALGYYQNCHNPLSRKEEEGEGGCHDSH